MPVSINFEITETGDISDLNRLLDRVLAYMAEDIDRWVQPYITSRAPVRTGRLRRSYTSGIRTGRNGGRIYVWGFNAPYASIVAARSPFVDQRTVTRRAERSLNRAIRRVNRENRL